MTRCLSGRLGRALVLISAFVLSLATPAYAVADTLSGRVVDPSDRAVVAARVIVMRGPSVAASASTDREGRFGPMTLAPATYDLVVSAPGFRLPAMQVTVAPGAAQTVTLKLALAAVADSIVVSARVETTASRAADSVTVVDRRTIDDHQITGVADALRLVPGFGVTSSGGAGAITSLFPRGGESDYTLVVVDGIPQNTFGGGFDAAHLDTAGVERIEVVRGPQSALFGSGAIGGIVQVITRNGGPLRGTVEVEGGGYGTVASRGSVNGRAGALTFGGSLDWLTTDGDTSARSSVGGSVSNDDYERVSGSGSIGWSDRASRRVRVDVKAGRNERGFPGPYGSDPAGSFFGLDTVSRGVNHQRAVGASAMIGSGRLVHQAQLNWARTKGDFTSPFGPSSDETKRLTGRYQLDTDARRVGISVGVEWLGEQADNTFITGLSFDPVPVNRNATGFFVEARPALGGRAYANLGLRIERLERSALESDVFSRPAFDSQVVWSTNPKIALAWFARANDTPNAAIGSTKLRLGAGTGIKSPTAFEIASTDNPDLKPERSRSVDVGIEQAVAGSRLMFDATWFYNKYDDLIVTVGSSLSGASRYRTDNIANARAQGLEVGGSWHPTSALHVRGGWTFLDSEVLGVDTLPSQAPSPFTVGQRLFRRPRSAGSADVTWTDRRYTVFFTLNGRGSMLDLEPNRASSVFEAPGFVTSGIGGSVQVHRSVAIYGRISNAFDRQYEETLGYPARGRSATIGLRVTHGR